MDEIPSLIVLASFETDPDLLSERIAGFGVDRPIDELNTTFAHLLAKNGNVQALARCNELGMDMDRKNSKGLTPLMFAAQSCCADIARFLLEYGVDVNTTDEYGLSALDYACGMTNSHIILDGRIYPVGIGDRDLRQQEWNRQFYDRPGGPPPMPDDPSNFECPDCEHHLEVVKLLIEHDADVNKTPGDVTRGFGTTRSPLAIAVYTGHFPVAEYLIACGADVNDTSGTEPPLCAAVRACDIRMVELLLNNGARADVKDSYGQTPASMAAYRQRADIVSLLAQAEDSASADPLALCRAAQKNDLGVVLRLLASAGCNVNGTDEGGNTALSWAANWQNAQMVEALLDAGANPNHQEPNGDTPLHECFGFNHGRANRRDTLRALIRAGADPYIRNARGIAPYDLIIQDGWTL